MGEIILTRLSGSAALAGIILQDPATDRSTRSPTALDPRNMPPDDDPSWFPVHDLKQALDEISDANLVRLEKTARIIALKTRGMMTGKDLLHEAVLRSLDGRRRWKCSVTLVKHLKGAMKSIASHEKQFREWTPPEASSKNQDASDAVSRLVQHFESRGDDEALLVLEGHAQEKTPKEIRADLGLDQTRYETIMKSIRRAGERLGASEGRKTR